MTKLFSQISTKNLIYFTLFFSPTYLIRFYFLNLLDILMIITIIVWVYENRLNLSETIQSSLKEISFILPSIFLILIGLLISSFLNDNLLKELGIIKSWFVLPLIFGFIFFNELKALADYKRLLDTIYYSALAISIVAIFYFTLGYLTYDGRLSAFYLSPNHLAMIISPGLLIGLWKIFILKKTELSQLILIIPILVAFFLTHSYGAWVALLISLLIISFFTHPKIALTFLALCFLFFVLERESDKFNSLFNLGEKSSLTSRLAIWQSSAKILSNNWFWGIGPGNFEEKYLAYQKYFTPYPEWAVPQPHNLFLAFWLQTGLLGLIGFLSLISLWLLKTIKTLISCKDLDKKNIILLLVTLLSSILIHGLVDTPYWKNDLALIFWSLIFANLALCPSFALKNNSK